MPFIRFTAFKRRPYVIILIFSLSKIILIYSRYIEKGLIYIVITALFSC